MYFVYVMVIMLFFFFKQKTAYELRISDWSSDVCSSDLVGGLTLALMTLPVIVIAGRNAIKSVPPSIRDAALGIGASRVQVVFHHVLPLALPGILTGTIIGMARALGETAPLLIDRKSVV